ncbi:MAG: ATP-binding cassette domain-containing protein [Myxococcales bacterium]|nr:ATP-binding cassette domain-containing protein [Myxococcales bacterium]
MSEAYTIEVDGLVAKYGERTILHGVDLKVRPGEVRVILGGSGSGKSTLLKHIIGLMRPAGGQVRLLGVDLAQADEPEKNAVLGHIGMLFQGGALLNSMTLLENVELPLVERTELPKDVIREMARMKLAMLGLEHATHLFPPELSGGMKKRAALARAMALDPAVLFCDEPSAGLDPITAAALDETLLGLRDQFGMSVVVVTHELASVETISDRVLMLYKGEVLADGPLPEVKRTDHPMVRAFFERHEEAEVTGHASVWQAMGEGRPA